ncbi:MAG: GspH/FimT family pseudopilin [Acidobacteria bacterium]|nr:GspH/FimT family pseudopilin [Acidobacteriota bacterium]MBI3658147.1 GspH/FimT family pseudopilin [Acidobacteriota bacterium]
MMYVVGNKPHRWRSRCGFSLIEIIVVIAIMSGAMVVAVGLSRHGLAGLHLKGSAHDVVATLRYAREQAVSRQSLFKVVFQVADNRLFLTDELEQFRKPVALNTDVKFRRVRIDGLDVHNRDMVGEVVFFPNGGSNSAEIVLENRKGAKTKIITDILTGAAKVVPTGPGD